MSNPFLTEWRVLVVDYMSTHAEAYELRDPIRRDGLLKTERDLREAEEAHEKARRALLAASLPRLMGTLNELGAEAGRALAMRCPATKIRALLLNEVSAWEETHR